MLTFSILKSVCSIKLSLNPIQEWLKIITILMAAQCPFWNELWSWSNSWWMVHISQALLQLALIGTLILSLSRQVKHQIVQWIIFSLLGVIYLCPSWSRIQKEQRKAQVITAFAVPSLWLRSTGLFTFCNLGVKCETKSLRRSPWKTFYFYNSAVNDSNLNANTITGWQKYFVTLIVDEK